MILSKKICCIIFFFFLINACSSPELTKETLLFGFEDENELNRIEFKCKTKFKLSPSYKKQGNSSLEIKFYPTDLVGFILNDLQFKNRKSKGFSFWVYNPSVIKSTLYIKVDTDNTGEYIQSHALKQGETIIHIPFNKILQNGLTLEIKSISIYRENIDHIETLYFDDFRITL